MKEEKAATTSAKALKKLLASDATASSFSDLNLFDRLNQVQEENPIEIIAAFQAQNVIEGKLTELIFYILLIVFVEDDNGSDNDSEMSLDVIGMLSTDDIC